MSHCLGGGVGALGKAVRNRDKGCQPRVYLLSGLLRCGQCGGVMHALSTVTGRRYYRCATRIEHRGDCKQKQVPADDIKAQVVELLRSLKLPRDWRLEEAVAGAGIAAGGAGPAGGRAGAAADAAGTGQRVVPGG